MNEQLYEITSGNNGISVAVYSSMGGYMFRATFNAGNAADTKDEVLAFFYHNCKCGKFKATHNGNPYIADVSDYLERIGYTKL